MHHMRLLRGYLLEMVGSVFWVAIDGPQGVSCRGLLAPVKAFIPCMAAVWGEYAWG